jgi:ACDE family multidrug resistance protein
MKRIRFPWLTMIILACVPFLMVLGNSVLIPNLPDMQNRMHVSKLQISLLITLFSVPAGVMIPLAGFLSDRLHRKWIIVPGLLVFGTGGIVAGVAAWRAAHPYALVLIGRVLQGIGASGTAPIAMALVSDLFGGTDRSKALGTHEAGNALGKVISPILGSAVALLAWFAVFFIFPVLCLPLAVALWRLIPEDKARGGRTTVREYLRILCQVVRMEGRWLSVAYLSGAAALFTLFGVLFYLSDLLEARYRVDGLQRGLILAIPLLVLTVAAFVTGWLIKREKTRMKWMMCGGLCLLTGSLSASIFLADRAWVLIALMSLAALGTGCVLPSLNALITSAVAKDHRGIVTSFYGSVRFLGVAFGPPVFTWLLSFSARVMFAASAGLCALCALLVLGLVHPPVRSPKRAIPERPPVPSRHRARV